MPFDFRDLPNTGVTRLEAERLGLDKQLRYCVRLQSQSSVSSGTAVVDLPVQAGQWMANNSPGKCFQRE